jgi:4-carboxymuconolactone decarboxylase
MNEEKKREIARQIQEVLPAPENIREDWQNLIIETVLERTWDRPGLSQRDKSLVTITVLTALNLPHELRLHIERGVSNGLSEKEISEAILHIASYAGFPLAVEGMRVAKEAFDLPDSPAEPTDT